MKRKLSKNTKRCRPNGLPSRQISHCTLSASKKNILITDIVTTFQFRFFLVWFDWRRKFVFVDSDLYPGLHAFVLLSSWALALINSQFFGSLLTLFTPSSFFLVENYVKLILFVLRV